jgi:ribosome-associated protein
VILTTEIETDMANLVLRKDSITLAQALKASGIADTGGQAKYLVRSGEVLVNDVVEIQPGKKLRLGDRYRLGQGEEWLLTQ